jgi:histone H2A
MASATKRSVAKKSASKKAGSATIFPSGRIGSMLRKGRFAKRVSKSAGFYAAGVISYLAREMLEVVTKSLKGKKNVRISPRNLTLAVRADEEMGSLLQNVTISRGGVAPGINAALEKKKVKSGKKSGKKSSKKSKKH